MAANSKILLKAVRMAQRTYVVNFSVVRFLDKIAYTRALKNRKPPPRPIRSGSTVRIRLTFNIYWNLYLFIYLFIYLLHNRTHGTTKLTRKPGNYECIAN